MPIYDISLTLSDKLPVWPDQPSLEFERVSKIADGEIANLTKVNMIVHNGTHIDAPCHYVDGVGSIENIPMESLVGKAVVLELPEASMISAEVLRQAEIPPDTKRILLKTRNFQKRMLEKKEFEPEYVAVTADGAEYLVEIGIELIGIDYLSIAPFNALIPTHQILLEAGVVVVEGLNLTEVERGNYRLLLPTDKNRGR